MIAMTAKQRDELNEIGWTVLESVLTPEETKRLSDAWDEVADQLRRKQGLGPNDSVGSRNGLRLNDTILELIDHPKILPLVVDAIGWNIQNRDSTFGCQAPKPSDSDPDVLSLGWHFDYEEEFAGTTIDGRMPLIDFKVGWYISDHTEPGHATILLVPGSYKWTREQRATWESWADPKDIFESFQEFPQGLLRELHTQMGATELLPRAGPRAAGSQLTDPPAAIGGDGRSQPPTRQGSCWRAIVATLVQFGWLANRAAQGLGRSSSRRRGTRLGTWLWSHVHQRAEI